MVAITVLCAFLVVACSASLPQGQAGAPSTQPTPSALPEPTIGPVTAITKPAQVTRPIDHYLPNSDTVLRLMHAETRLLTACYRRHGATGKETVRGDAAAFVAMRIKRRATFSRLWGFFDPATASKYGYGPPAGHKITLSENPPPGLTPDVVSACTGQTGEVTKKLPFHEHWASFLGLSILPDGGPPLAASDSRFLRAQTSWSECMQDKGFHYQTVVDASVAFPRKAGVPASAREIATAIADVACKRQTNLVGIAVAVQSAYDQQYIEKHRSALDNFTTTVDRYLRTQGA